MKLPSVEKLATGAANTIKRFPLELLFALAGTIAVIVNIELDDISRIAATWCVRVTTMANLGLLLSLAVTLFTESKNIIGLNKWGLKLQPPLRVFYLFLY